MRSERGTVTIWVLGLCVAVMFLGGLSLDLWRGITVRRDLAARADAAATAGANGLDEAALRRGVVALDPARVRAIVHDLLVRDGDGASFDVADVAVVDDRVVVRLEGDVPLTLLGLFDGGGEPFRVVVTAEARPDPRE